jgi:hypothetical protein
MRYLLAWALFLFAVSLALDSRHNDFPYYYHPDEPGKVEQVLTGKWNFHHPMLLLATTKAAVDLGRAPRTEQAVVETGRWVSATFMALAIVAFSLLAYAWRGWPAAVATGGALVLNHQLFELAHYLKEDSALLAGLALTFLMLLACWWQPSPWRAGLLGAACALAVSGKYLGAVAIALAVPVLWKAPGERRAVRFAAFAAGLTLTFIVVNLPLLRHLATFRDSFGREVKLVVQGQGGMTRSVPHAQYWNIFIDNTTPAIWLLLLIFLHARWRERRNVSLPEWMIIGFPFVYAVALSCSPKSNDRYFLPATAVLTLLAGLGTMDAARLFTRLTRGRFWKWGLVAAPALLILGQLPSWLRYEEAFQHDDTRELTDWLRTKVPPDAVIARDSHVRLPDPSRKKDAARVGVIPQKVVTARVPGRKRVRLVGELGTLEEIIAMGVTHVAVSESDYGRFFLTGLRPQEGEERDFARQKAFYTGLLRDGELVFERDRGTVIYLHPGIRVYRIAKTPSEGG